MIKDKISVYNKNIPSSAQGKFRIDLTDPLTGKVKERVEEKNHVFIDSLFSTAGFPGSSSPVRSWYDLLSTVYMTLTTNQSDLDLELPYVPGNVLGYGIPSMGSSGTLRGAYNVVNQVLGDCTPESARFKYQFDFTTAQANGTIGTIGLTDQYATGAKSYSQDFRPVGAWSDSTKSCLTCDGRYSYAVSTAGVITIYDNYLYTSSTVDVSAIVGTLAATTKRIAFAPATGRYYIVCYNSTASLRNVYEFSDKSFTTLLNTYAVTNLNVNSTANYVYGNYLFALGTTNITPFDFVNNVIVSPITLVAPTSITTTNINMMLGSTAHGKYIFCIATYSLQWGGVFDMSTQSFVAPIMSGVPSAGGYGVTMIHPAISGHAPVSTFTHPTTYKTLFHNSAVAAKKLDTPVTKTSANGMTVTYELEVFW